MTTIEKLIKDLRDFKEEFQHWLEDEDVEILDKAIDLLEDI